MARWLVAARFLDAVREGRVSAEAFDTWLVQDALFVSDLLSFQGRLLARAPRRAQPVLAAGVVVVVDELGWFERQASARGLNLAASPLAATRDYAALLQRLDEAPYPVAVAALWVMERVRAGSRCAGRRHRCPAGRRRGTGQRGGYFMSSRLLVLCYHNVNSTWCFPSEPGAGERGLERQLTMLRRLFQVIPLEEAVARRVDGRPLPRRAAAITLDDGYRDNLTLAVPTLERLGLPATFFLVPGLLFNDSIPWWEVLSWAVAKATVPQVERNESVWTLDGPATRQTGNDELQRRLKRLSRADRDAAVAELSGRLVPTGPAPSAQDMFLDWDESAELLRRGFSVGSHTCSHPILSGESPTEQSRDLIDSRQLRTWRSTSTSLPTRTRRPPTTTSTPSTPRVAPATALR